MKRSAVLVVVLLLGSAASLAQEKESKLGVSLDVSYHSKWLSKGFEAYGQQGAVFETIDLDLWGTGFGTSVIHRSITSSGYVDKERFDYNVYYGNSFFEGQPYLTKYRIKWGYEHYPRVGRNHANTTHEWQFDFSWPQICPFGFEPFYTAFYEYPAGSDYDNSNVGGFVHVFGLGYDLKMPALLPNTTEQVLNLSGSVSYNDGLGGRTVDHDWSHATFGASTKIGITKNMSFVPGIYHQITMDKSVSRRKDISYCILSMKYKF